MAKSLINGTTQQDVIRAIDDVESRIHDEMSCELFLYIESRDAEYYYRQYGWIGESVIHEFPAVEWEAQEAATCYALERSTACVFHLMRILEYGLAALASALSISIVNPNWHQILQHCEGAIKTLKDLDPSWKSNEQFYNSLALEFRHFQRAVRNHTAHVREIYSQSDAKKIMDHVASFMQELSTRLHQVPMP